MTRLFHSACFVLAGTIKRGAGKLAGASLTAELYLHHAGFDVERLTRREPSAPSESRPEPGQAPVAP
jgi:hypothetical protein